MSQPREVQHGDDDSMEFTPIESSHCHDCWRYTDDVGRDKEVMHSAVTIVVNSGTLDVRNSEAFKAADAYLTAIFTKLTPAPLGRWKVEGFND